MQEGRDMAFFLMWLSPGFPTAPNTYSVNSMLNECTRKQIEERNQCKGTMLGPIYIND